MVCEYIQTYSLAMLSWLLTWSNLDGESTDDGFGDVHESYDRLPRSACLWRVIPARWLKTRRLSSGFPLLCTLSMPKWGNIVMLWSCGQLYVQLCDNIMDVIFDTCRFMLHAALIMGSWIKAQFVVFGINSGHRYRLGIRAILTLGDP